MWPSWCRNRCRQWRRRNRPNPRGAVRRSAPAPHQTQARPGRPAKTSVPLCCRQSPPCRRRGPLRSGRPKSRPCRSWSRCWTRPAPGSGQAALPPAPGRSCRQWTGPQRPHPSRADDPSSVRHRGSARPSYRAAAAYRTGRDHACPGRSAAGIAATAAKPCPTGQGRFPGHGQRPRRTLSDCPVRGNSGEGHQDRQAAKSAPKARQRIAKQIGIDISPGRHGNHSRA